MPGWILTKQPPFKSSRCALSIGKVIKDLYQTLNFVLTCVFIVLIMHSCLVSIFMSKTHNHLSATNSGVKAKYIPENYSHFYQVHRQNFYFFCYDVDATYESVIPS